MSKERINIWGREFEMDIRYDCYTGEEVLDSQKAALTAFLQSEDSIQNALEQMKKYCLDHGGKEIGLSTIENIFKYVSPKYLYISRDLNKHVVAVMCNYKFDQENGIAVIFENEKLKRIGKQDIIL